MTCEDNKSKQPKQPIQFPDDNKGPKSTHKQNTDDDDEVLMEKGEEEDFLEELASWGKLTLGEVVRKEEMVEEGRKGRRSKEPERSNILDDILDETNDAVNGNHCIRVFTIFTLW